jgi:myosin-crossreactive antigen
MGVVYSVRVAEQSNYTFVGVTRNKCDVIVRLARDVRFISNGQHRQFFSVMCLYP